jgi:hypothetical protein
LCFCFPVTSIMSRATLLAVFDAGSFYKICKWSRFCHQVRMYLISWDILEGSYSPCSRIDFH